MILDKSISSLTKRYSSIVDIIQQGLQAFGPLSQHYARLYERYLGINPPISNHPNKVKVHTNFYRDIVKTKAGYMFSSISIAYNKDDDAIKNEIRRFQLENSERVLNSAIGSVISATGAAYRLMYVKNGRVRLKNLFPSEVIYVIGNGEYFDPDAAMWYYKDYDGDNEVEFVEYYDRTTYTKYRLDNPTFTVIETKPHLFSRVPIIPFLNNEEGHADPESAISLMDSYDITLSNSCELIQKTVDAIGVIKSDMLELSDEDYEQARRTGFMVIGKDDAIHHLERKIPDQHVLNNLRLLRKNIYGMSNSVDYSDEDMSGNIPVVGFKQKISRLENASKETERHMQASLLAQYSLLADFNQRTMRTSFDPYDISLEFKRTFPKNVKEEAETLSILLNTVSRRDAYSQVSFIDNPDEWADRFDEENDVYLTNLRDVEESRDDLDAGTGGA